jgi:RNA polymerase sigma factor for flagellar operon FliA
MTTYNAKGRTGQKQAIGDHLPMVKKLAFQLKGRLPANVEVDDLIQAGNIGLLDAMSRYEKMETAQFETYAVQRIRGAMLDELRSNDWLTRGVRQNMRKIEQAISSLQQQLARPPKESEIAAHLKMSLDAYQQLLGDSAGHQLIYFEEFHQDSDSTHDHFLDRFCSHDSLDPLATLINEGFRGAVVDAINALPERDKLMMGLYYEQDLNLKEIGAVLGVTESRVSQLHSQAIARIRAVLKAKKWTGVA